MFLWHLIVKEMSARIGSTLCGLCAVAVATGTVVGAITLLAVHDTSTAAILARKQNEVKQTMAALAQDMRKATLKLKFNLVILPAGQKVQEWHSKGYASQYMPEAYVEKLADSGIVTVRHFLPSLQQKIRWPETGRTIILVGTRGEVPNLHKNPLKPLVQPVPSGTIVLGYELHTSLGLHTGDTVRLMGREFEVHSCYDERGSKDDITAWIPLDTAQGLLDKQDKINAILALECLCAGVDGLARIREDIQKILPGTQVREMGTKALARLESRMRVGEEARALLQREERNRVLLRTEYEQFSIILLPLIISVCVVWLAMLGFRNVRCRITEISILQVLGYRTRHIMLIFLAKSLVIGVAGGIAGLAFGIGAGVMFAKILDQAAPAYSSVSSVLNMAMIVYTITGAVAISLLAGWVPAVKAVYTDPARILSRE
jgi:putative ABC transport system permease protein